MSSTDILPNNQATKQTTKVDYSIKETATASEQSSSAPEAAAKIPKQSSEETTESPSDSTPSTPCLIYITSDSGASTPNEEEEEFIAMWQLVIALEGLGFGNPNSVREKPKITTLENQADGYALKVEFDKVLNSSKAEIDAIINSLRSVTMSQRGGGLPSQDGQSSKGGSTATGDFKVYDKSYWTCCACGEANDADDDTTCSCGHDFCNNCSWH